MIIKLRIAIVLMLMLCSVQLNAQTKTKKKSDSFSPWYVGIKGGTSLGVSTLASFGADKTRIGYDAGLFVGYNINRIFSTELSATFGNVGLSAHDNVKYWLGSDGNRYFSPVQGMSGYNYSDLYSSVNIQKYGLQLNVDLLQLFPQISNTRWMLHASPTVSAVISNATIKQIGSDTQISKGENVANFGIGGDISVGYRITDNLSAYIYSGATYLAGGRFDGMPEHLHRNNYTLNSGIKLSWSFGKSKRSSKISSYTTSTSLYPAPPKEKAAVIEPTKEPIAEKKSEVVIIEIEPSGSAIIKDTVIVSIFFEQNQTYLSNSEFEKLEEILELMETNPNLKINAIGSTDTTGAEDANQHVSYNRAKNVRWWLIQRGISLNRIKIVGKGVDLSTQDNAEARRVDITNQLKQDENEK